MALSLRPCLSPWPMLQPTSLCIYERHICTYMKHMCAAFDARRLAMYACAIYICICAIPLYICMCALPGARRHAALSMR